MSTALGKIVEDEQKLRDEEASFKRAQASTEQPVWYRRPVMSSYCAIAEAEGVYLIPEIKNAGYKCTITGEFQEGRPKRHGCSDCQHRIAAQGPARDRQR